MPQLTILYWRDIPAQILVGRGRQAAKLPLPERFEQAIDRAAMRVGARDSDAYLAQWRREGPLERDGDADTIAAAEAARLDAAYPPDRLRALVENGGHTPGDAGP